MKYSPFEIEEVMLAIPGVRTALAIAFPNTWYGEEVGAYIVCDDGADVTAEQVLAHCRAHMPAGKCPKGWYSAQKSPLPPRASTNA